MPMKTVCNAAGVLLAGFLLISCGNEEVPVAEDQFQVEPQSKPLPHHPPMLAVDELISSLLGAGVAKLRYDRTGATPDETGRERQVYLEMLGTGVEEAEHLVSNALRVRDYREVRRSERPGDVHLTFGRQGMPDLVVRIRSRELHSNLNEPDARSSTYVTYML